MGYKTTVMNLCLFWCMFNFRDVDIKYIAFRVVTWLPARALLILTELPCHWSVIDSPQRRMDESSTSHLVIGWTLAKPPMPMENWQPWENNPVISSILVLVEGDPDRSFPRPQTWECMTWGAVFRLYCKYLLKRIEKVFGALLGIFPWSKVLGCFQKHGIRLKWWRKKLWNRPRQTEKDTSSWKFTKNISIDCQGV